MILKRRSALLLLFLLTFLALCFSCAKDGQAVAVSAPSQLRRCIALTFDDGPSPRCTPRLLDGLQELGARATFFVVGCQVVKDPDIVQRMAAEGHQVGNHSYDHAALNQLTSRQALEDLEKNDALLRQLLGDGDYWVRPPYGLLAEAEAAALTVPLVNWSVDTEDWRTKDSGKILDVIYRCTGDGDIVLLHDRYQNTVDAVLAAIGHLQEQGYVFVTVADTGCGISPEVMGSIYEPFLTTKSTGSGLGLLIVRRLVPNQNGERIRTSQPGQGTTITVFLPRVERTIRLLPSSIPS